MDAPYDAMFGVVAPMGTPAAAIDRVNAAVNEGLRSPDMRTSFAKLGIEPTITTPQEFAAIIALRGPEMGGGRARHGRERCGARKPDMR